MVKFIALISFCLFGMCFAMPASNEQLDKRRRNAGDYLRTEEKRASSYIENLDTLNYEQHNLLATVNDISVNAVSEDKRTDLNQVAQQQVPTTVEITGITTGANPAPANPAVPENNGGFKPQRTGSMFARLIDDIFQIPITVLQNVARLITNPFTQARKEATSLTDPVK